MNQMVALRSQDTAELPCGTRLLSGQYQILDGLQQGGFGITYVARDSLERQVVVKECFPSRICQRKDGRVSASAPMFEPLFASLKQQFIREARRMAKLKHPSIVAVHQVFEENGTAYMALDYIAGIDLITVLEEEPARLTPYFLESALRQALSAVQHIHSHGLLHRDIAPDNIRVDAAGRITLIDFGSACERTDLPELDDAAPPAVKDGYSPHEFYRASAVQDYCSDLYSLGATFYHLITGEAPPNCSVRRMAVSSGAHDPYVPLSAGNWDCGNHLITTIDRALQIERADRPQSAEEWSKALDAIPARRPTQIADLAQDPVLENVVSRLVQETNQSLTRATPAQPRADEAARARKTGKTRPVPAQPQWKDIFGMPISDVERWQSEQERAAAAAAAAARAAAVAAPPVVQSAPEPAAPAEAQPEEAASAQREKKSLLGDLINRCFSRSPDTVAA